MITNLLFDLDGTLSDSREGVIGCFQYTIGKLTPYSYSDDEIQAHVGAEIRTIFQALLKTDDREKIEEAIRVYRKKYDEIGITGNLLYPGIPEMLAELHGRQYNLFVVTMKNRIDAAKIIRYLELDGYFTAVYGPSLEGVPDRKVKLIEMIIADHGLNPAETVMIGDRNEDISGGKQAGVKTIGITWGFSKEQEIIDAGPDRICRSPQEIIDILPDL